MLGGCENMNYSLPRDIENYLMTFDEVKTAEKFAKKEQRITNDINAQVEVVKYSADDWKKYRSLLLITI